MGALSENHCFSILLGDGAKMQNPLPSPAPPPALGELRDVFSKSWAPKKVSTRWFGLSACLFGASISFGFFMCRRLSLVVLTLIRKFIKNRYRNHHKVSPNPAEIHPESNGIYNKLSQIKDKWLVPLKKQQGPNSGYSVLGGFLTGYSAERSDFVTPPNPKVPPKLNFWG